MSCPISISVLIKKGNGSTHHFMLSPPDDGFIVKAHSLESPAL
jgi:hypothetical protein